jgi:hypothetical protein
VPFPSHLFDFKNDERLYKTLPMPTEGGNAINAIATDAVNPAWEPARLRSRHRDEFRYLFPPPDDPLKRKQWEKYYLPWAQDLKERTIERGREIRDRHSNEADAIKEDYSKLYEDLRGEIAEAFPSRAERKLAAAALWHVETTSPNLNEPRRECAKLSRHLNITFHLEKDYQRLSEALPKDTYILSVPFEQYNKNQKGQDLAGTWKAALDRNGIQYEATLDPNLPLVRFALIAPNDKLVKNLETNFGGNDNFHISNDALNYRNGLGEVKPLRIVLPTDYHWLEATEDLTPKSALVLNLFAEEICAQLQNYQFDRAELIGQKHNDFKDEDFGASKWQGKKVKLSVGALDKPDDSRHGFPIVQLDGKNLAMFSVNSPKLPVGTIFEATISPAAKGSALSLDIDPTSVQIPEPEPESRSRLKLNININVSRDRNHINSRPSNLPNPTVDEASQVLHAAIAQCYAQQNQPKFRMTQDWTAFINSHSQDCFVRDRQRKIIFSSNLKTHQITQPLSEEDSRAYTQTIRQLNSLEKQLTQKAQQL